MESNLTVVQFKALVTPKAILEEGKRIVEAVYKKHTMCYINKSDYEIHEQLTGWDMNYNLLSVMRLHEPINVEAKKYAVNEFNVSVLFYNVMNMPYTEVFFNNSYQEIVDEIEKRNYQSYIITNTIQTNNYKYDSINSITKHKDTD